MKNWFSNCFPLLYICLHCGEVCICWHFGAPGTPGFYVGAQHDPEKNEIYFNFFILTQKVLITLFLYLICKLLLNRGYMWTKMGPVWLFKHPPPPPRAPHIAKDVNIFTYMSNYLSPAMITIVFPCCTYVSSVMMSSWQCSTSGFNIRFPKTPQN